MAALDYRKALVAAVEAAVLANNDLAAGFKPGNRAIGGAGVARQRVHNLPADFGELAITAPSGSQSFTGTPTFGLGRASNCDAIVPVRQIVELTLTYEPESWAAHAPGAQSPEVEALAGIMAGYPRLGGYNWIRSFTIEDATPAGPAKQASGPRAQKTTITKRITFDLRLHASQLRN